jgi:hypothetical protein
LTTYNIYGILSVSKNKSYLQPLWGFYINGRPFFAAFLAPVFLRGKGLVSLLACKVNSDDPKIRK